jgi:hypothetical protein
MQKLTLTTLTLLMSSCVLFALPLQSQVKNCEFGNREFEGQIVTIRINVAFDQHGGVLESKACPKDKYTAALLYPGTPGVPEVGFRMDSEVLDRLRPFFRVNGGVAYACGTLKGQILSKQDFRLEGRGFPVGNGFGNRGLMRFAFIVQSVVDIRAC